MGTKAYAVIMHHIDPEGITKWYWTLYNIPADVRSLPANVRGIGIMGNNSINGRTEYAPPHSKGPGDKTYILTVYALSSPLEVTVPADQVTRDVLLASMKNKILASSELQVVYAREGASAAEPGRDDGHGASAQDVAAQCGGTRRPGKSRRRKLIHTRVL